MAETNDFKIWSLNVLPIVFDDYLPQKDLFVKLVRYVNGLLGDAVTLYNDYTAMETGTIGDLEDLHTTEKGSIVGAINEVKDEADTLTVTIGDLDDLYTTEKASVVGAINELDTDKLDKPTLAGTSGQVLTSDGSGGQVWAAVGTGEIVVDNTLTVSGAAADAKVTGDEIGALKEDISSLDPFITYSEAIATSVVSSLATNGTTGAFVTQGGWKVSYFAVSANEFVKLKVTLASSVSSVCSFSTSIPANGGSSSIVKYSSSGTEYEIEYTAPSAGYICVSSTNITVTINKTGYNLNSVISSMKAKENSIGLFSDLEVSAIIPECYMYDIGTFRVESVSKITIYKKYSYNNQYLCGVVVFNGGTAFAMYNSYLTTTAAENALKAPFWIPPQADFNGFAFQIDWSKLTDGMHTYEVSAYPEVADINHSPSIRDYNMYQKNIGLYDGINPYAETYDHYKLSHNVPEKTAFGSGNLPSGAHNWATPSVIITNSGKILVAADARMGTGADSDAQIAYVIKYENADLSDASPTMQVLFSASNTAYTNISFVVDRTGVHGTTGRVFAFALKFASGSYAVNQTSSTLDCVYKYSDDDGDTWSAEVSIKSAWNTTKYNGAGTAPTNGIQLSDGTLVLPAMFVAEVGVWKSGLIYKKTNGSWTFSSMTPYSMDNECAVYADSSNNIYLNCRTNKTSDHLYKYNITNDKWSPEKIDYDNGVAIQRSIIGRQYGTVYPFGTPYVLLRTMPDPSSPDNRNFFTIWLSKDGKKWIRLYQFYKGNNGGYGVIDCYNDIAVIAFMGTGGVAVQNVSELLNNTDLISNTLNVIDGSMAFRIQRLLDVLL